MAKTKPTIRNPRPVPKDRKYYIVRRKDREFVTVRAGADVHLKIRKGDIYFEE
jgi:hypothetical protein